MTNSTISGLPAATALDGTELVPVVQGGVTKAVTSALLAFSGSTGGVFTSPVSINTNGVLPQLTLGSGGAGQIQLHNDSGSGLMRIQAYVASGNLGLNFRVTQAGSSLSALNLSGSTLDATFTGNLRATGVGKGLYMGESANGRMGVAQLSGGQVTVANTSVNSSSTRILLTPQNLPGDGVPKAVSVSAIVTGTSFTIKSSSGTDTSNVFWFLVEAA